MIFRFKIFLCLFLISFLFGFSSLSAQTKNTDLKKIKKLYRQKKYANVLKLATKNIKNLEVKTNKDSLLKAKLLLYKHIGAQNIERDYEIIPSLNKLITNCPKSSEGDSLKAALYNRKAYFENNYGSTFKSYKSITKSLKLLQGLKNPNPGYIMGAYLLLSTQHVYYGNFEKAEHYMRLAENVYTKNKLEIDNNTWELNGNHHRLGVIANYRKIYMLWQFSKDSKDSLPLLNTMKLLENMHNQPDFHKEERIYYSTALNHVGDWFISYKHDSLSKLKDVSLGLKYLFKANNLIEKKGYTGTPWAIKYNLAKGFIRGNQLKKADSTMSVLFKGISETDGRLPFFLAQKAQIKAKKQQKDSAILYFYKSIEKIHKGKDSLHSNFDNFTSSKSYNHTKLLIRIGEELTYYYKNDTVVQKKVNKLYLLALKQFENSYLDTNFNPKQNNELRKILKGILKSKKTGLKENHPNKMILNKYEAFKNKLEWKKFYENRYTNSLPELDSLKNRQLELASLLSFAKLNGQIRKQDSINRLIERHNTTKKKLFPQLDLFSNFIFSIEELQQKLTTKDIVLKYILLNDELAVYQITKNSFKVDLLKWTINDQEKLQRFITKTQKQNYNANLASEFGELLIPNLENRISNIIINPDGQLYKLPFEILIKRNTFLTEKYNIRYTSNLGFINTEIEKSSFLNDVHIYAPNYKNTTPLSNVRSKASFLEGANNEAKKISKLFPSKLYNQQNLSKKQFIKTASKAKLLHLAMHADVNNDYPEFSRLLFSNNLENEEEHLYLEEIYGLSLGADLAILSACNTGVGLEKNGSLESFQRAFTFAGVPATIASLWEVPDASTEKIMILFYKNLKDGQTKSEALKNAKIKFRKEHINSKLSAPYYWAGFVVYGNDSPIVNTTNYSSFIFITVILTIIIFLGIILSRKLNIKVIV